MGVVLVRPSVSVRSELGTENQRHRERQAGARRVGAQLPGSETLHWAERVPAEPDDKGSFRASARTVWSSGPMGKTARLPHPPSVWLRRSVPKNEPREISASTAAHSSPHRGTRNQPPRAQRPRRSNGLKRPLVNPTRNGWGVVPSKPSLGVLGVLGGWFFFFSPWRGTRTRGRQRGRGHRGDDLPRPGGSECRPRLCLSRENA